MVQYVAITHSDSANNPNSEYTSKTTYSVLSDTAGLRQMDCNQPPPKKSECKACVLSWCGPSQIVHFTSNRAIYQNTAELHQ